jgi:hypothetical protein
MSTFDFVDFVENRYLGSRALPAPDQEHRAPRVNKRTWL